MKIIKHICLIGLSLLVVSSLGACSRQQIIIKNPVDAKSNPSEGLEYDQFYAEENINTPHDESMQTKQGIYTRFFDKLTQKTRHFIWGYTDETKTSDWQWEFTPENEEELPFPGSTIEITGVLTEDFEALSGYGFQDVTVRTIKKYTQRAIADIDMNTMSNTIQHLQISNILHYASDYESLVLCVRAKFGESGTLLSPDDSGWELPYRCEGTVTAPPSGTVALVLGRLSAGTLVIKTIQT